MVNLTEGGNVTVMKTQLSANVRVDNIVVAAVNILFSVTASSSNILILIALRKVTSLHPPTKLLFQYLAIPWRWSHFPATHGHPDAPTKFWCQYHLPWVLISMLVFIHYVLWSIGFCINCPECWQTSRPVLGIKVQTSCNTEASSCSYCQRLFNRSFDCVGLVFSGRNRQEYNYNFLHTFSHYLAVLLHEDRPKTSATSVQCTIQCPSRTSRHRRNSTELRTI